MREDSSRQDWRWLSHVRNDPPLHLMVVATAANDQSCAERQRDLYSGIRKGVDFLQDWTGESAVLGDMDWIMVRDWRGCEVD